MSVDKADPRALIADALAAYLTDEQVNTLIDEVLAISKRVPVVCECPNCGHSERVTLEIPDAKAVVGALTDLLAQGFGRPGEARVEDGTITFKRLTVLSELEGKANGKRQRPQRSS